ncbi:hypothetical protein M9H77_09324 [Catharanthus roseus]|uniref:Uncharacterized protein n=1 Tax=Catharanthus roseus TaxID=4058 RepID=A0ACC0C0L9_CATRO|nr:hypothetical protein M9H77_09324 [Catharanthus roseus]
MAEVATSGSDELWDLPKKDKCRFLYAVMVSVTLIAPSNYGVHECEIGKGFGHFTVTIQDMEDIKTKRSTVTQEPGPVKGGSTVIAFVKDPDVTSFSTHPASAYT